MAVFPGCVAVFPGSTERAPRTAPRVEGVHPTGQVSAQLPQAIAAIDIGTNSIHMVVARVASGERFEVLTRHKEMVRLGSGGGDMKHLEPDAIERGVATLRRCQTIAEGFDAEVWAVATSAVREASNADDFLRRAHEEAGVTVNVISGVEEARLIQLGVLQSLPVFDKELVLIDVGGGSTEVLFGQGTDVHYARSLKLGALRMSRRFFPDGVVEGSAVQRCRKLIRARLASAVHEAEGLTHDVAVASSGTAETLAAMAIARRGEEVPAEMNAQVLRVESLKDVVADLASASTTEDRKALPGIDSARADILLGGALVLEQICEALGVEELTISDYALREGVLLDALARRIGTGLHHLSDLRRASVTHLLEVCDDDPDHALQVARLALQLHDLLGEQLGLDDDDRELLEAAAMLCNVGLFISHSAHHKHSYYVIRNSEHLTGFTDNEKEMIAQLARYHRKSRPSEQKHPLFAALASEDRRRLRSMASLLRIAITLDRNHDGAVQEVTVRNDGDSLVVVLHPVDSEDLELECFSAAERNGMLVEELGMSVRFEAAAER